MTRAEHQANSRHQIRSYFFFITVSYFFRISARAGRADTRCEDDVVDGGGGGAQRRLEISEEGEQL